MRKRCTGIVTAETRFGLVVLSTTVVKQDVNLSASENLEARNFDGGLLR